MCVHGKCDFLIPTSPRFNTLYQRYLIRTECFDVWPLSPRDGGLQAALTLGLNQQDKALLEYFKQHYYQEGTTESITNFCRWMETLCDLLFPMVDWLQGYLDRIDTPSYYHHYHMQDFTTEYLWLQKQPISMSQQHHYF